MCLASSFDDLWLHETDKDLDWSELHTHVTQTRRLKVSQKNSKHFVLLPLLLLLLELPLLEDEEPGFTKALAFTNLLLSSSHSGVGASRCDFTRALF